MLEQVDLRAESVTRAFAAAALQPVMERNYLRINKIAEAIATLPDVAYASAVNQRGVAVAGLFGNVDKFEPHFSALVKQTGFPKEIVDQNRLTPDQIYHKKTFEIGGQQILDYAMRLEKTGAEIRVGLFTSSVQQAIHRTLIPLFILLSVMAAGGAIAVFLVAKTVSEPIRELSRQVENISKGHLDRADRHQGRRRDLAAGRVVQANAGIHPVLHHAAASATGRRRPGGQDMIKNISTRHCAWLLALTLPTGALAADLTLGITPRFAPEELAARVTPLKERLESAIGKSIEIVVSPDFKDFERRLKEGEIDIAYVDPTLYPSASDVVDAVAMSSEGASGARLRGIVITRTDSSIVSLEDLKGHSVSIVSFKSTGGYLSQKVALEKEGIDLEDLQMQEAIDNKQENVVMSVFFGDVDAGFIDEDALHIADNYVPPNQIRVIQRTAWMPNWAIAVKRSLPDEVKTKLRDTLVGLSADDAALKALNVKAFVPASDADYNVIRRAAGMAVPQR